MAITRPSVNYAKDWVDRVFLFPGLVWSAKRFSPMDVMTRGQSTSIIVCIWPFSAWWQKNEHTNNRMTLLQACSWPLRRQSFAMMIITTIWRPYYNHMIVMIIIHQLFLLKVGVITDVTREGDRNKVSSWGSGREFIGRFIVNINLGSTEAETKAVIFHSSSLFMDPILVSKKMNTFTKLFRESSTPPYTANRWPCPIS